MNGLRICIVEDEILTAENLGNHLRRMGHEVIGTFSRCETVFDELPRLSPDLFLIDIRLKGPKSGLDLARELNSSYQVPFMFVTSNTDCDTVRKAMEHLPVAYITKPFSYDDIFIGIELSKAKISTGKSGERKIEIRTGYSTEWLALEELLFLEANRSYVRIHLENGSRLLRQSMGNFLKSFEPGEMIRTHRSFAVNPQKVESVSYGKVIVAGHKIPLGRGFRLPFQEALRDLIE